MRRSHLLVALIVFACGGATALAQTPQPLPALNVRVTNGVGLVQAADSGPHATPDQMLERILSFDRNGDGVVTSDELSERMQGLMARGDRNGDGSLDRDEIRAIAAAPQAPIAVRGFQAGHYGFIDGSSESSREHVEGALADLKLPSEVEAEAATIVKDFMAALDQQARADLFDELQSALGSEQMAQIEAALSNLRQAETTLSLLTKSGQRLVSLDVASQIGMMNLPPGERDRALKSVDAFTKRMRPGDAERTALLEQLQGTLTDEERDDFRAALERRPIAKTTATFGPVHIDAVPVR